MVEQLCDMREKGYIVRNISAACYLRTPYILSLSLFCFYYKVLMLEIFITTAGISMFSYFLIPIKLQFPQQRFVSICFFVFQSRSWKYTAQSFSILFLGKESSWIYREYFVLTLKLSTDNLFLQYL